MSGKYSQTLLVYAKQFAKDALEAILKSVIHKIEEDSGVLIVNKKAARIV